MTLASLCTLAGRNDHTAHLSFSLYLEWTAQGALKPRERQGEFKARQIIIHGNLALDPLGIEDIQKAGGALAKAQLGNAQRLLRLFQEPFLIDEDLILRRFRLSSMLVDGTGEVVPGTNQLCLFFSLTTERRRNVSLLPIP